MTEPIALSDRMLASLNATRPWVKFLAIVGIVGIALAVLFGLAMITGMFAGFVMPGTPKISGLFGTVFGIFYFVMALIYVMPILYLFRYAKAITGIQGAAAMAAFEDALKQQKSFWKYLGVLVIVLIVIYILFFVISMIGGMYMATHHH